MKKRVDPESMLRKEHQGRQVQRSSMFVLTLVPAGLVLAAFAGPGLWLQKANPWLSQALIVVGIVAGILILLSLRSALQWDRAIILRLGRFHSLKGPGVFGLVPIVDKIARYVDMRIRATEFFSERTLTKDTVPVNVDAICFWLIWDAQKAVLEVENYYRAIVLSAQTALRDAIGTHTLAELLTHRDEVGKVLQSVLDHKTNPWGITVQSVEVRDVVIPRALEDAMSMQAQAERERQARIILGTAETEIAAKFVEAAKPYQGNPVAVHLRAMNMLYEGLKERGSLIIVPSTAVDTMNLGTMTGLASLGQGMEAVATLPGKPAPAANAPAPSAQAKHLPAAG
jgi:regulator of protease activity HflC (stomatin/prohibitin superfamily)